MLFFESNNIPWTWLHSFPAQIWIFCSLQLMTRFQRESQFTPKTRSTSFNNLVTIKLTQQMGFPTTTFTFFAFCVDCTLEPCASSKCRISGFNCNSQTAAVSGDMWWKYWQWWNYANQANASAMGVSTFNLGIKPKGPPMFHGRTMEDVTTWVAKVSNFFIW